MTDPTPLSPAAQAVVAAIEKFDWECGHFSREEIWYCSREVVAAALRAAADLERNNPWAARIESAGARWMRDQLLAIAAELEAQ